MSNPYKGYVVGIDCGHGIDTAWKRSPDGKFREYKWNREVGDLLFTYLREDGIDARLIVTETNDISLTTRANRMNKICKEVGAGKCVLVSIHSDAAGSGKEWMNATGWSCYTTKGKTNSDKVAEFLYDAFESAFPEKKMRMDKSDGDRDKEANFTIIYKANCPAVLIENFFYDNKSECEWLLLQETKERIARATSIGIRKYLDSLILKK